MATVEYRQTGCVGLFDTDETLARLSRLGNPLAKLSSAVDFEMFRPLLEGRMLNRGRKGPAGCKPRDVVMMFKAILLKRLYNLSDEQTEYQIGDRLSFKEFLGLSSGDRVPDARTLWLFQDRLAQGRLGEGPFALFRARLEGLGLIVNEGKIVDASFAEAPRQRNGREENEAIKSGAGAGLWADAPHKRRQKDIDARWAQKDGVNHYGYKNHVKADAGSKLIDAYAVTSAEVHDSRAVDGLVVAGDAGQEPCGDNAYVGKATQEALRAKGVVARVTERASRGHPPAEAQRESNRLKSKVRARVEHIFGFACNSMGGLRVRTVGLLRATLAIGLANLAYNLCRYEQIVRLGLLPVKG